MSDQKRWEQLNEPHSGFSLLAAGQANSEFDFFLGGSIFILRGLQQLGVFFFVTVK